MKKPIKIMMGCMILIVCISLTNSTDYSEETCSNVFGIDCDGNDGTTAMFDTDCTSANGWDTAVEIEEVWVNSTEVLQTDYINVTCQVYTIVGGTNACYWYIYYRNTTSENYADWLGSGVAMASGQVDCDSGHLNVSTNFSVDNVDGVHQVRCGLQINYNDNDGCCNTDSGGPITAEAENNDVNFTVTSNINATLEYPTANDIYSATGGETLEIFFNVSSGGNKVTSGVTVDNVSIGYTDTIILNKTICQGTLDCSVYTTQTKCENCSECDWVGSVSYETPFNDSFTNGVEWSHWTENGEGDWEIETPSTAIDDDAGQRVAHSDDCDTGCNLTSDTLDLSSYAKVNLTFVYGVQSLDSSNEYIALDIYNGSWHPYVWLVAGPLTANGTVALNLDSTVTLIRFHTKQSSTTDYVEVDIINVSGTTAAYCDTTGGGSCGGCAIGECDTNCSAAGCSVEPQLGYVSNSSFDAWSVNVTVPSGLSGSQDLFINTTYSGSNLGALESDAINYYNINNCSTLNIRGEYHLMKDIIDATNLGIYDDCIFINSNNIILDCHGHTIDGTDTENNYGVYVISWVASDLTNITVKSCNIREWHAGIYFENTNNSLIFNNTLNYSSYNIDMEGITNVTIESNTVYSTYYAGIWFEDSTTKDCTFNNITNNMIYIDIEGGEGISLLQAHNNNIFNNSIIDGGSGGFFTVYSELGASNNKIYNNFFNVTSVYIGDSTIINYFNTTQQIGTRTYSSGTEIGGNYWTNASGDGYSDTCTDSDTDGFCDTPYNVSSGNKTVGTDDGTWTNIDYLPLSDEYAENSCSCPSPSADWEIEDGDDCDLTSECHLGSYKFHITSGSLSILYGGSLSAGGCYVSDGSYLYIDDSSGGLYCE